MVFEKLGADPFLDSNFPDPQLVSFLPKKIRLWSGTYFAPKAILTTYSPLTTHLLL